MIKYFSSIYIEYVPLGKRRTNCLKYGIIYLWTQYNIHVRFFIIMNRKSLC